MNKLTKIISIAAILSSALSMQAQVLPVNVGILDSNGDQLSYVFGSDKQDFVNGGVATQLNADSIFGFDDWIYIEKTNNAGSGGADEYGALGAAASIGLNLTGDVNSGTWSVNSNVFSTYEDVVLVMKGGVSNYIAFDLNGETSGSYITALLKNNGQSQGISHISAYVRGGGTPPPAVPEPSTYAMFGAAFLILGVAGYRSRNRKS